MEKLVNFNVLEHPWGAALLAVQLVVLLWCFVNLTESAPQRALQRFFRDKLKLGMWAPALWRWLGPGRISAGGAAAWAVASLWFVLRNVFILLVLAAVAYGAVYSFAWERYESRVRTLENRANVLLSRLYEAPSGANSPLSRIPVFQQMTRPLRPDWRRPSSVWRSFSEQEVCAELNALLVHEVTLLKNHLEGAQLVGIDLHGVDMQGAQLKDADLRNADLRGVDFRGADLTGANFEGADLTGARLANATARGAKLWRANLQRADLRGADFSEANMVRAMLDDAQLWSCALRGADMLGAQAAHAIFWNADLSGANVLLMDFSGARYLQPYQAAKAVGWKESVGLSEEFREDVQALLREEKN